MNGSLSYYNMTGVHLISLLLLFYILQKINTYETGIPWVVTNSMLHKIKIVSWVAITVLVVAIMLR